MNQKSIIIMLLNNGPSHIIWSEPLSLPKISSDSWRSPIRIQVLRSSGTKRSHRAYRNERTLAGPLWEREVSIVLLPLIRIQNEQEKRRHCPALRPAFG